jgi:lipopolysaccharide assembly outer membrane protein LptD (OstA)
MASKGSVLSGEKLKFNLKTHSGELVDTYGLLSPFVRYETDRFNQVDQQTLTFKRLDFSSCSQIVPRWKITCRRGKIKKEKYVEMNDVLLRIKNIPILYLPYLRYPIQKDGRTTGLLFPKIGNSSLRGFSLQNSFFWAIRPNIDTTFSFDYYSKLGLGFGNEWRYLFGKASGSAQLYWFSYRENNGVYNETRSDYYLEASHRQTMSFLNSRLILNVNTQSRPEFLRLFDNNFDRLLTTNFQSSFSWTSTFSNLDVSLNASRRETYYTFLNQSRVVEYLPALSLNLSQQKLGKLPGYFSLAADYQSVRRGGVNYEEEPLFETNVNSQRLTVVPEYQLPLLNLPWLNFSLNVQSKNTLYAKSIDPKTKTVTDEPLYMKYHTVQASLQGPVFFRIYNSGKNKLKHVIEPEFEFRYVTAVTNRDRLISVDYFDYPSYSYAGFSLTSRLLAKNEGAGDTSGEKNEAKGKKSKRKGRDSGDSVNELLSLRIAQEYFFDPAEASYFRKIGGVYPTFSELSSSLRLRPNSDLVFDAALAYNYYTNDFSRFNLHLTYQRPDSPLSGTLSYSSYKNPYAKADYVLNRSILGGNMQLTIPQFPIKLQVEADYDFTDNKFRYGSVKANFDYQCLVFNTECKIFDYFGRSEFQFRFGLTFGNLGAVADFFGGK